MGQDQGQERTRLVAAEDEKSPEQLRAEIADVREDLGDTAAALAALSGGFLLGRLTRRPDS